MKSAKPSESAKSASATTTRPLKRYTAEEVAKHNKRDDCWVIIDDTVCDVTTFLDNHPGGADILLQYAGKDCTLEFKDIGHSPDAILEMEELAIGKVRAEI